MHIYTCVPVCMCVCIHGGQRSSSGVSPHELSTWILEAWILPLKLNPACLDLPSAGIIGMHICPLLLWVLGLNSESSASEANVFLAESSPQPYPQIFA